MTSRPKSRSATLNSTLSSTLGSTASEVALICEVCGKKYKAKNSFGLHVCNACTQRGGAPEEKKTVIAKPKAVLCYVCGREFFQDSLKIHIPQCLKKRAVAQSKLPPELRRPLIKPKETPVSTGGTKSIDKQNEEAYEVYQASLIPCENCGRTFSGPDRLQIHMKSCRPDAPARPVPSRTSAMKTPERVGSAAALPVKREVTRETIQEIRRPATTAAAPRLAAVSTSSPSSSSPSGDKPSWKKDHERFQAMMKAAKGGAPAPVIENDDYVPCPHCGRRFNETAAERHIPKCSNIINKPKPPPSRASVNLSSTSPVPSSKLAPAKSSPSPSNRKSLSMTSPATMNQSPTANRAPSEPKMFCSGCGAKYASDSSRFCGSCGRKKD